jgi:hypothetical protein
MNNQEILDSNPVGFYTNVSMSNGKPFVWACNNFRSLADIKRIVELEKEMRDFEHAVRNENELIEMQKNQVIRDLEQRANGIMDVRKANIRKKRTLGSAWAGGHIIHNMQLAEEELRNQAKALKEPKT